MNISLKQLNVFVTIAQEKTITAAADKLFLSKPAISMALGELEKVIGHKLFDRVNNRLFINAQGKRLLPLANELLERTSDISHLFDSESLLNGELKIGASDTIGNQVAPYLLSDFRKHTDQHEQQLLIGNSALICQKLSDYELDIGLIEGKTQHPNLFMEPWHSDEMCVVCSPNHPLAKQGNIQLGDLEKSQWLLREAGSGSREFFLQRIAPRIEQWSEAFELNTTEAIINSTAAGLGIACLSQLAAQHALADGRLVELKFPLDMKRRYWLLLHKEKYQSPLLQAFIAFCQQWQQNQTASQ
ncbi:LysR substrate-binding domain-containing protein [Vibrio sp. Of7-15]|uniref:LysR substrate-binding domain-containing protein n=1 Tax=Vibrio sp. Of7-15 TaxID=2724879 RepID=UPI001EF365A5|nr:LysR substrate-binding domain-containing protein [Vibrio sp. Of7-15]MCG7498353.1 LysR substrate-binding domain-containing protein [Vibrio sp. Of7-15]